MLTSLQIQNFQKHKKRTLELDPHLTTIVGASDKGKSSILRALRWLCLNRPGGTAYIRHGQDSVSVKLEVDGKEVRRERIGNENLYWLDDKKFSAFGTEPPHEVKSLLNVDDINFSQQHDSPFWLMKTPGEVSRELNQIINLSLIDQTLSNIASSLRQAKSTVSLTETRLAQARSRREELKWVRDAHTNLLRVEELEQSLATNRSQQAQVNEILIKGTQTQKEVQNLGFASVVGGNVVSLGEQAREIGGRRRNLEELLNKCIEVKGTLGVYVPNKELGELRELEQGYNTIVSRKVALTSLLREIKEEEEQLWLVKKNLATANSNLKEESKGQCPVCGNKVT